MLSSLLPVVDMEQAQSAAYIHSGKATETRRRQLRDFGLLVLGATIIGNSSVLVRLGEVPPAATAFWRMLFAMPVFVVWALLERRGDRSGAAGLTDPRLLIPAALAGLAFAIDLTLSNIALALTTMTNFIILVHLAPVIVVIAAWFLFRERPTWSLLVALVLALVGAVLLVQSGRTGAAPANALMGDFASVAAAAGYAGFILGTRAARLHGGTGAVSCISALAAALFCLVFAWAMGEDIWPKSAFQWSMLLLLGLGCHALGQGLSAYAVGTLGASVTSIVLVYGVLVTVAGGWVVFDEIPGLLQLAGGALVLTAVMICRPR
jgi:drug/metabolite transporter (DMT)-like permease